MSIRLIKFGSSQWMQQLVAGEMYMNTLAYFAELEPIHSGQIAKRATRFGYNLTIARIPTTTFAVVTACPTCLCVCSAQCTSKPPTVVGSIFLPTPRSTS